MMPAQLFQEAAMFVVSVTILVKPELVDAFITATLDNATNTRKEPGNIRFDVLRGTEDTARFLLYEVYHTPEDFAKHQQTPHYFRWRDTAVPMMREPRVGVKHTTVFYGDSPT
jgi:(4S)-4-hydroxy-5-phosphonooxypentane-2,3-dione isomerase